MSRARAGAARSASGRALALGAWVALAGCVSERGEAPWDPLEGPADPLEAARAYVEDPAVRRAALEASVAGSDTAYARVRLERYALAGVPEDIPVISPPVRPLRVSPGAQPERPAAPLDSIADAAGPLARGDLGALVEAGRVAFGRYPVHLDARLSAALRADAESVRRYGLEVDDEGVVRGAVEVQDATGTLRVALTCAACHDGRGTDGSGIPGVGNDRLRLAELLGGGDGGWAPGRLDVTGDGIENPVRAPDLRPIRWQTRLHHSGNLANGRLARMVRIETLLSERLAFRGRPDRTLVAAMSLYLDSLASSVPAPGSAGSESLRVRAACGGCHASPALAGPVVAAGVVGTDPAASEGSRGTGGYRAPSLLGVADRPSLLHDGSAPGLRALLGLEPSSHRGHPFGLELPVSEREAIAAALGAR